MAAVFCFSYEAFEKEMANYVYYKFFFLQPSVDKEWIDRTLCSWLVFVVLGRANGGETF